MRVRCVQAQSTLHCSTTVPGSGFKRKAKRGWAQIKNLLQSELSSFDLLTGKWTCVHVHTFNFATQLQDSYSVFPELLKSELLTLRSIIHKYKGQSPVQPTTNHQKIWKLTLTEHYHQILRSLQVLSTVPIMSLESKTIQAQKRMLPLVTILWSSSVWKRSRVFPRFVGTWQWDQPFCWIIPNCLMFSIDSDFNSFHYSWCSLWSFD